jgi:phosphoserine phosphatase RsbU/P
MKASRIDNGEVSQRRESSKPPSSQSSCGLEIVHLPSGRRRYENLSLNRVVIGSGPQADIVLDDASVSQIRAELIRGPSGQWWIHDLESDEVTSLHGSQASGRSLLTTGEDVVIGPFKLRLNRINSFDPRLASTSDEDNEPPRTVRFGSQLPPPMDGPATDAFPVEFAPRRTSRPPKSPIGSIHLSRLMSLSRNLMQTAEASDRGRMLCTLLAGDNFCVETAAILRLTGPTTVRVVEGPVRQSGTILPLHLSQRITERFWETRRAVCYHTPFGPTNASGGSRRARIVDDCPHLAGQVQEGSGQILRPDCCCHIRDDTQRTPTALAHIVLVFPLADNHNSIDGLLVEMDAKRWDAEWCSVVALITEAFQQAELVWEMRAHVRQAASVDRELEMARQIQQSLVPQQTHFDSLHQQMEVVVGFEPCHWVGGDYADAMPMPDGRVLLAIADVCGKGMQAALVASSVHTFVRATVDVGLSLTEMVSRLNRYMCRYLPDHVFITMLCIAADLTTGEIEVVSAGHPPALIVGADGRAFELDIGRNVGLGVTDAKIASGIHRMGPDQLLFLYTDGLTEAVNKQREPLGVNNLAQMLSEVVSFHGARGPHAMREAMLNALRGYRGSLLAHDDTTFLMARLRIDGKRESIPGRSHQATSVLAKNHTNGT